MSQTKNNLKLSSENKKRLKNIACLPNKELEKLLWLVLTLENPKANEDVQSYLEQNQTEIDAIFKETELEELIKKIRALKNIDRNI